MLGDCHEGLILYRIFEVALEERKERVRTISDYLVASDIMSSISMTFFFSFFADS